MPQQSPLIIQSQLYGTIEKTLAQIANGTSTTETAFQVNGNSIAGINPFVLPLGIGNTGVFIGGSYSIAGVQSSLFSTAVPFRVRATGFATTGDSETITIKLYNVPAASIAGLTSTSFTGAVQIATTGAVTIATTTGPFSLVTDIQAVATSTSAALIKGQYSGNLNGTVVAGTTLSNAVTGLLGEGDLNFFVTATFGTGHTGDLVQLSQLSIETVQ